MKTQKQNVLITGGTSGIGYEMVKILHPNNHIIVIGRNQEKLAQLAIEFPNIKGYQADLSQQDDIKRVGISIAKDYKTLDILINNAAIQNTPHFIDEAFVYETIASEITLNYISVCSLCSLLLPSLLQSPKAIILNINSGLALTPKTSSALYSSSKAAMDSFSQSLRYQLENTPISVQQAFLDIVDTQMTAGRGQNKMTAQRAAQEIIKGMENNILDHDLGRVWLLRLLLRLTPSIAKRMMKKN